MCSSTTLGGVAASLLPTGFTSSAIWLYLSHKKGTDCSHCKLPAAHSPRSAMSVKTQVKFCGPGGELILLAVLLDISPNPIERSVVITGPVMMASSPRSEACSSARRGPYQQPVSF
ncbi:hypothetical protein BS17DRAFT_783118 [Gyrodon lividus]|nr:hypothetical protein BS17DRAFT_783118 [Gyrodon lividus]